MIETNFVDDLLRPGKSILGACGADGEERFFRFGQDVIGLIDTKEGLVHHALRGVDDLAKRRFFAHDLDVAKDIQQLRQTLVKAHQVAQPAGTLKLGVPHQFVGKRDAVDSFSTLGECTHAQKDSPVRLETEVLSRQFAANQREGFRIHKHCSKRQTLSFEICGEPFLEGDVSNVHRVQVQCATGCL